MNNKELDEINKQIEAELLEYSQTNTDDNNLKTSKTSKARAFYLGVILLMAIIGLVRLFL